MAPSALVDVTSPSAGNIVVRGVLTFETASRAHEAGLQVIADAAVPEIEMNFDEVTDSDSAGLAVLLDWRAAAERSQKKLHFTNLPDVLRALAEISEVESLLIA